MNHPELTGLCNLLCAFDTAKTRNPMVQAAVVLSGNWVGGRFIVSARKLRFITNKMNRRMQNENVDVDIDFDDITGVSLGRMMIWAKTVDVHTADGLYRFRTTPFNTMKLFQFLTEQT